MRFLSLTLQNFGIYRGTHEFNLAPTESPAEPQRHITVISGHNGAGKSTLFQAIGVALHGSLALGDRVTQQNYSDFVLNGLHRFRRNGVREISAEGGVALSFRYVRSGRPKRILVERRWQRAGSTVRETLNVLEDGKRPDVPPSEYQAWINDHIPPSLGTLCFFDAEQLNVFSSPEIQDGLLNHTLRRVLGLDIVERLEDDLDAYTLKTGGKLKTSPLKEQVIQHQEAIDALGLVIADYEKRAEALSERRSELQKQLALKERAIAAEGGSYAARRPLIKERLIVVEKEIEGHKREIQELAGELLPFTLAPDLCRRLIQRLEEEATARRAGVARELWDQHLASVDALLARDEFWTGIKISAGVRNAITERVRFALSGERADDKDSIGFVHDISEDEHRRIQGWITLALEAVPVKASAVGAKLRELEAERRTLLTDLERSPDEERLASFHREIQALQDQLRDVDGEEAPLYANMRSLKLEREEKTRQRQRLHEQLAIAHSTEAQLALAHKSKLVLRTYGQALASERIAELERELVRAFNALCRKEYLLSAAHISSEDWRVILEGVDGHRLSLNDFSAGERQLYALALLKALRTVSSREIPLAIDTPLARLDDAHRMRLLREYIPSVSNQVLLFATDVELDDALIAQLEPHVARVYRLEYSTADEATHVVCSTEADERQAVAAALDVDVLA